MVFFFGGGSLVWKSFFSMTRWWNSYRSHWTLQRQHELVGGRMKANIPSCCLKFNHPNQQPSPCGTKTVTTGVTMTYNPRQKFQKLFTKLSLTLSLPQDKIQEDNQPVENSWYQTKFIHQNHEIYICKVWEPEYNYCPLQNIKQCQLIVPMNNTMWLSCAKFSCLAKCKGVHNFCKLSDRLDKWNSCTLQFTRHMHCHWFITLQNCFEILRKSVCLSTIDLVVWQTAYDRKGCQLEIPSASNASTATYNLCHLRHILNLKLYHI